MYFTHTTALPCCLERQGHYSTPSGNWHCVVSRTVCSRIQYHGCPIEKIQSWLYQWSIWILDRRRHKRLSNGREHAYFLLLLRVSYAPFLLVGGKRSDKYNRGARIRNNMNVSMAWYWTQVNNRKIQIVTIPSTVVCVYRWDLDLVIVLFPPRSAPRTVVQETKNDPGSHAIRIRIHRKQRSTLFSCSMDEFRALTHRVPISSLEHGFATANHEPLYFI